MPVNRHVEANYTISVQVTFQVFENGTKIHNGNIVRAIALAPGESAELKGNTFRPRNGYYGYAPIVKDIEAIAR